MPVWSCDARDLNVNRPKTQEKMQWIQEKKVSLNCINLQFYSTWLKNFLDNTTFSSALILQQNSHFLYYYYSAEFSFEHWTHWRSQHETIS